VTSMQQALPATTLPVAAGVAGLAGAVAVRVGVAGGAGVRSPAAGLLFAVLLAAVALGVSMPAGAPAGGVRAFLRPFIRRGLPAGLAGAAVLCAVPLVVHLRTPGGPLPLGQLPLWASVVTVVAVAEEALLRGALWTAAAALAAGGRGDMLALALTTPAFTLLHVPLYGWAALPLDLAVGLLLGGLRMLTGGWGAPAVAHTVADLAGWWLR
jgi:hypothetical protein